MKFQRQNPLRHFLKEGIDISTVMRSNVRNAAAHMRFVAGGGLIEAKQEGDKKGDLIVTMDGEEFGMDEAKKVFGPERITHRDDVYSAARRSSAALYRALIYWCYVNGDAPRNALTGVASDPTVRSAR